MKIISPDFDHLVLGKNKCRWKKKIVDVDELLRGSDTIAVDAEGGGDELQFQTADTQEARLVTECEQKCLGTETKK